MKINPNKSPPNLLLIKIWNFIMGVATKEEFEQWVYQHYDSLNELLDEPSFFQLVCFNFSKASQIEIKRLKADLRYMIDSFPTNCECVKLSDYEVFDCGYFKHIDDSLKVIDYVEKQFISNFTTLKTEINNFSGIRKMNQHESFPDFFQDSTLYQCSKCSKCWLVTLNESQVDYHIIRLSEDEAENAVSNNQWPERSSDWFRGYMPTDRIRPTPLKTLCSKPQARFRRLFFALGKYFWGSKK